MKEQPVFHPNRSHTFVICAYGDSPYLEECIRSVRGQTVPSQVLMATSTPNERISGLAEKYRIPLYRNQGEGGLAGDWNFAFQCARTSLVTLAHQDDRYGAAYAEEIQKALAACARPLLAFTDYHELREGERVRSNRLLRVKRGMLWPLRFGPLRESVFVRRRILSFGNPICCPAVTLVKENLPGFAFPGRMRSNTDWLAWEEISQRKGAFVYVPRPCMEHRIHPDSATSGLLEEKGRRAEDLEVLRRFWPGWAARAIEALYQSSEKSNRLES